MRIRIELTNHERKKFEDCLNNFDVVDTTKNYKKHEVSNDLASIGYENLENSVVYNLNISEIVIDYACNKLMPIISLMKSFVLLYTSLITDFLEWFKSNGGETVVKINESIQDNDSENDYPLDPDIEDLMFPNALK